MNSEVPLGHSCAERSWEPPTPNEVKINVDAAAVVGHSHSCAAAISKDSLAEVGSISSTKMVTRDTDLAEAYICFAGGSHLS